MAARGARSRKIIEKQINKQEERKEALKYAPLSSRREPSGVMSPIQSWGRPPSNSNGKQPMSIGSSGSIRSKESGNSSKLSSAGAKIIRSVVAPGQEKFVTTEGGGRMTAAPRGRRGGVPPKLSEAGPGRMNSISVRSQRSIDSAAGFRPDSRTTGHLPKGGVGSGWEKTKMWYGGLTQPKPFRGFEHVSYSMANEQS
jgi:hypothetical protein